MSYAGACVSSPRPTGFRHSRRSVVGGTLVDRLDQLWSLRRGRVDLARHLVRLQQADLRGVRSRKAASGSRAPGCSHASHSPGSRDERHSVVNRGDSCVGGSRDDRAAEQPVACQPVAAGSSPSGRERRPLPPMTPGGSRLVVSSRPPTARRTPTARPRATCSTTAGVLCARCAWPPGPCRRRTPSPTRRRRRQVSGIASLPPPCGRPTCRGGSPPGVERPGAEARVLRPEGTSPHL